MGKEKYSENLEGVDLEQLFRSIGKDLMLRSPEAARALLGRGGYTPGQIEELEGKSRELFGSAQEADPQETIDLYERMAGEFERDGEENIARGYRNAANKIKEELKHNTGSE